MKEYHKITTAFERDPLTNFKKVIIGQWALPEFAYLADAQWIGTEKIDGTNVRVMWDGTRVIFGGKTDKASLPTTLITRLAELFYAGAFQTIFGEGEAQICLYGEGYGVKIQHGHNYLSDAVDFRLFDIWVNGLWLDQKDVVDVAHRFECEIAPVYRRGTLSELCSIVQDGFSSTIAQNKDYIAEGLVMRPAIELQSRRGNRIIAKIKHIDF